jgi:inositol-phosphate transport system substrate-binding protein
MKKFKKAVSVLLVFVMMIAVFSGCGKSEKTSSNSSQTKKAGEKTSEIEVVTIKAQTRGAEKTRTDNLVAAAEKLNKELEEQGKNIQVKVEGSAYDGGMDDYRKQFILGFKSKKESDIFTIGHEDIAWLAKGKYILTLDSLKDSDAYADVYDSLWEAVNWNGHIWGALQDTEARPVYYNKNVLKQLGWSDEDINNLPEKVKKGEFTLGDMTRVAKEAMDQGLVEWGIMHRPTKGPDLA